MPHCTLSQNSLIEQLTRHQIEGAVQDETGQVSFTVQEGEWEFPCFMRIYPDGELLQVLGFIPVAVEKEVYNDLARILHLMNKELDLPGLGMDEESGTVFYRIMIPCKDKQLDEDQFRIYLAALLLLFGTYGEALVAFSSGQLSFDDLSKAMATG